MADHEPPAGAKTTGMWTGPTTSLEYTVAADWLVLRKREKPAAEIFSVSYTVDAADRPVVFVFNGGPGASSAFLHLGAIGPRRIAWPADGSLPPMPAKLVDNAESWLAFADVVFVDPVGTGFSRVVDRDGTSDLDGAHDKGDADTSDPLQFFGHIRDLESFCEFIGRWLSARGRWGSPVFIAGESYGGYRVGRLVRMVQEKAGIGLSGAILISPALELSALTSSDYDVLPWVDMLPTMAAAAVYHGRSRAFEYNAPLDRVLAEAERFATGEYTSFLVRGASMSSDESAPIIGYLADLTGLPLDVVTRVAGRVTWRTFARELLRGERKVLAMYDATLTATDPFPDREPFGGPDPGYNGISSAYAMGINQQLRSEIGVETNREYILVNEEASNAWREDAEQTTSLSPLFRQPPGATDDLRYAMSLNPYMQVLIVHGRHDLATPYYSSERARNLMRLSPATDSRLTVRHLTGGHMFYSWETSRREFAELAGRFVADAIPE